MKRACYSKRWRIYFPKDIDYPPNGLPISTWSFVHTRSYLLYRVFELPQEHLESSRLRWESALCTGQSLLWVNCLFIRLEDILDDVYYHLSMWYLLCICNLPPFINILIRFSSHQPLLLVFFGSYPIFFTNIWKSYINSPLFCPYFCWIILCLYLGRM